MNKILKQYLPEALVVVVFALMSFLYFYPADVENRVLNRHDASASKGLGQELSEYQEQTGEVSRWTDAIFSGMPTYQIAPSYGSQKPLDVVIQAYHLGLPEYVWYLFAYLLGFYILLRAFNFKWHLAALGSILWAFSSYYLIIIAAGHIWKVMALAYLPPMIGGIVLCYRGKYLWGFVVTALFSAMEINANHVQMTYYYLFIVAMLVVAWLFDAARKKELAGWFKASLTCAAAAVIGILMNGSNLYHTWEYQKETMRGKSELVKGNAAQQTSSGLDRDYITQWSYGGDELMTLMIPNANGGSHDTTIGENAKAMEAVDPQFEEFVANFYPYWGEQPYTAGPVYVGAFVVMLFILGLFIVKGAVKWALLAATILSFLLSLGHNLQWFTDLFIDYMPMYAKFRTVSSILVIAEFTMPLLAMLALKRIYDEPDLLGLTAKKDITKEQKRNRIFFFLSLAMTAGVCLFIAIMPDTMPHLFSQSDLENLHKWNASDADIELLKPSIVAARKVILSADCWRSFWIIIVGAAFVVGYQLRKFNKWVLVGGITVLCLFDMWQVDKRYLKDSLFVNVSEREAAIEKTRADEEILEDKALGYRVLDLTRGNPFNNNDAAYYHKSIGGYHAAKLRRYQELIEEHLQPEIGKLVGSGNGGSIIMDTQGDLLGANYRDFQVLCMLNMKYIMCPVNTGATAIGNPWAFGAAWYVDSVDVVDNANKEIEGLKKVDLRHHAVVDKAFQKAVGAAQPQDSLAVVTMTKYAPNHLEYDAKSSKGGVIVFSEIYYPGWTATVDGKDVEIGRANYVLRAINIAPGEHKVVFDYHPQSVETTENLAYIAMLILLLALIAAVVLSVKPELLKKKN